MPPPLRSHHHHHRELHFPRPHSFSLICSLLSSSFSPLRRRFSEFLKVLLLLFTIPRFPTFSEGGSTKIVEHFRTQGVQSSGHDYGAGLTTFFHLSTFLIVFHSSAT
ncbi:hypothetical protein Fcan01_12586 [Folsomia candida]|uniref:Uncharacterized protein n=1 Tax=Folsomia candida TaxID=158441 RepID=A0A226E4G3_FOLCA|nr:hypothetical protein Fcan01_12586 [Folsomia candida]